jgi:fatty acid desaturase
LKSVKDVTTSPPDRREGLTNLVLTGAVVAATLVALFALPLWLLAYGTAWGWMLLPLALLTNTIWAVAHEAMHGHLVRDRRINHRVGRLLAILIGSSFRLLRFGHLMHHRFNRYRLDIPDLWEPGKQGRAGAKAIYLLNLFIGHYLVVVAMPLAFLLPRSFIQRRLARVYAAPDPVVASVRDIARQALLSARNLREIRQDAIASTALVALSAFCYGSHWPLLVAFLAGRGVLLSFIDNVHHFGTPANRRDFAWNLSLPAPFQFAILNMNLHQVHHDQPELPWNRLGARFRELDSGFDASFAAMALRQLSGPLTQEDCRQAIAAAGR